ncbi:MAG TPA: hypothetical protein VHQ90_00740 [Thermoanaerobaculia bacterium]|nr:hypothetical protein [Thermoanaerobaculia bacterium]
MWVRIDDSIAFHPNFLRCAPEAFALFIAGLCFCHRYQTGGLIPKDDVPHLLPSLPPPRAMDVAGQLTCNGPQPSWVDEGGHFRVDDNGFFESDREDANRRAHDAERQRRCRARRAERAARPVTRDSYRDVTRDQREPDVTRDITCDQERDVTRDITRDRDRDVTRDTPLPEPLPPPPTLPIEREIYTSKSRPKFLGQI